MISKHPEAGSINFYVYFSFLFSVLDSERAYLFHPFTDPICHHFLRPTQQHNNYTNTRSH